MKNRKLLLGLLIFTLVGVITSSTKAIPSINMEGGETWTSIGPSNMSGRTRAALFDKYNKGVVYVGSVGGLYVSVNNGRNWKELKLGNGACVTVTALAQDTNGVLYVGTGEGYYDKAFHEEDPTGCSNSPSGMKGKGIYKMNVGESFVKNWANSLATDSVKYAYITNSAITFTSLSSTNPTNNVEFTYINTMVCVGTSLYVGTKDGGLRLSTNGGNSFISVPLEGNASVNIYDLAVNSDNRIAVSYQGTTGGCIAISSNAQTFTKILDNTTTNVSLADNTIGRIKLTFGEKHQNVLYAVVASSARSSASNVDYNGTLLGVYRTKSLDNVSWFNIAPATLTAGYSLGYGMSICANDRGNSDVVYIGGNNVYRGFDANNDTTTVGAEEAPYYWTEQSVYTTVDTTGSYVAPNIHNILLMPNPTTEYDSIYMFTTTDAGVFIHYYDTITHVYNWSPSNVGMNSLQAYKVVAAADGSVMAATQSNAIVYLPSVVDSNNVLKRGQIVWSINNPGYLDLVSNSGDGMLPSMSGSGVFASGISKLLPLPRKPFILSRPYTNITRTYGNQGDFETINDQVWTFGGGNAQSLMASNIYTDLINSPVNTPMAFWETFNAPTSVKDSVTVKLTKYTTIHRHGTGALTACIDGTIIYQGDSVLVTSDNLGYPFFHVFKSEGHNTGDELFQKDNDTTIKVQCPVQARLLIGTNTGVFICGKILDFSRTFVPDGTKVDDLTWAKIYQTTSRGADTVAINNRVHALGLSMDGNYAFIAVDKYSNYYTYSNTQLIRVKGLNDTTNISNALIFNGKPYDTTYFQRDVIATFPRKISSIACNPLDSNKIVLTFDGYYSTDGNIKYSNNILSATPTFTDISLNPTNATINDKPVFTALYETMKNPNGNILYVGSDDGIYKTTDYTAANVSWVKQNGVPEVPVYNLWQQTANLPLIHYYFASGDNTEETQFNATTNAGVIYAATYGKGLLINTTNKVAKRADVSITNVEPINKVESLSIYPNPASSQATIAYSLNNTSKVVFKVYDMNGRLISTLDKGQESMGLHNQIIEVNHLTQGVYMIQMLTNSSTRTAKLIVK